jgi:adenosine deaminase
VPITVNTDTPAMLGTTLGDEMALVHSQFGLDLDGIADIVLNGVRASFLPAKRKAALADQVRAELEALKAAHLEG